MKRYLAIILIMVGLAFGTVPDVSNTANFACNGIVVDFAFNYPLSSNDTSQVDVILRTVATGVSETLTETTDYSIAATNNDFSSGGTVTTVATYSSAFSLTVVRDTPETQTADLSTKSSVSYASLESYFDKITMISQDLSQDLSLTLTAPLFDSGTSYIIPEAAIRANSFLAFDSSGDPIASTGGIEDSPASAFGITLVQSADAEAARGILEIGTTDDVEFGAITGTTGTFSGLLTSLGLTTAGGDITLGAGDDLVGSTTSNIAMMTGTSITAEIIRAVDGTGIVLKDSSGVTGATVNGGITTLTDGSAMTTSAAPNADAEIANMKYVDDSVASRGFGEYTSEDDESNEMLKSHAYLANQDGFVTSYILNSSGTGTLVGYIGTTTNPAGAGDSVVVSEAVTGQDMSITIPVASGKYFEIVTNQATIKIYWHPVGTLIKPTDNN